LNEAESGAEFEHVNFCDEAWPDPAPLPSPIPLAPKLEVEMIPLFLRAWAIDCSNRMQASIEYLISPLLVAFSILIGRQVGIRPKQYDPWTIIANLWGMLIGSPSAMKSPCQKLALKFFDKIAQKLIFEHEEVLPEWRAVEKTLLAKTKGIEDKIKNLAGKPGVAIENLRVELLNIERELKEKKPILRRLYTSDATQEILGVLAKDNPYGIGVFTDELITIFRNCEKPGREGERAFLLGGWAGDGRHTVDRITRGHINIPAYCLAIFGNIQPGVLNSYLSESMAKGLADDGFIQRFQIMVYPDVIKDWKFVDQSNNQVAEQVIQDIAEKILKLDTSLIGGTKEDGDDVPFVRFSSEGQVLFKAWLSELERRLRNEPMSNILEGHLGKYRSLMPSLALIFHVIECVGSCQKQEFVCPVSHCGF
jgi:putative DNA primase/helicase